MAATEQSFPATGAVIPSSPGVIVSPFQFVADPDTFLRVTSVCSVAGVVVAMQGRRVDSKGALQTIQETHAPNSNRTVKTTDYLLGDGAIQNLTVFASVGAPLKGQCYVMVQLLRNVGATAIVLGTLLGGYVTSVQALGFPGSPIVSSTDGEPCVRNIAGTSPALGTDFSETCPTGARWELVTVFNALQCSAAVANRSVSLVMRYAGTVALLTTPFVTQQAGVGIDYSWAQNLTPIGNTGLSIAQQPLAQRQFLRAADSFGSFTQGLQAGDSWFSTLYQVREWLEVG